MDPSVLVFRRSFEHSITCIITIIASAILLYNIWLPWGVVAGQLRPVQPPPFEQDVHESMYTHGRYI